MRALKDVLLEVIEDARGRAAQLEEENDAKEELDSDFYFASGQITVYTKVADVLENIVKEY